MGGHPEVLIPAMAVRDVPGMWENRKFPFLVGSVSVPLEIEYNGIKIEKRVYPSDYTGPDIISVNNSDF